MAQKIEFIRADSLEGLAESFNSFVEQFVSDARFIITPIGFVKEEGVYVMAVRVEASHKRTFLVDDSKTVPNEGKPDVV